jgi:site-specific recombinase XerD
VLDGARDLPSAASHVPDPAARGGNGAGAVQAQAGHLSIESTRVYLHLANDWLAGEYLRAAALIDADTAAEWTRIETAAPQVATLMHRYPRQLGTFLAPMSVAAAENALRQLARWMITEAGLAGVSDIRRDDIEDYKVWLAVRPRSAGQTITRETHRQRMRTVRQFFERIIEWDWLGALTSAKNRGETGISR